MQPRVLAGTGAHLDSATGEFGADAWRKARGLAVEAIAARDQVGQVDRLLQRQVPVDQADQGLGDVGGDRRAAGRADRADEVAVAIEQDRGRHRRTRALAAGDRIRGGHRRSEEHTSELQSLMRISYAVFSLKTKTILSLAHTPRNQNYQQLAQILHKQ